MNFTRTFSYKDTDGTSNITHEIESIDLIERLQSQLTPGMMKKSFPDYGAPYVDRYKGYTEPEWYWKSDEGEVLGIGFRYGIARLRGKGIGENIFETKPIQKETVAKFISMILEVAL